MPLFVTARDAAAWSTVAAHNASTDAAVFCSLGFWSSYSLAFYTEFASVVAPYTCELLITSELNIHSMIHASPDTMRFNDLIQQFGLAQRIAEPTHDNFKKLDKRSDIRMKPPFLSDHGLLFIASYMQAQPIFTETGTTWTVKTSRL